MNTENIIEGEITEDKETEKSKAIKWMMKRYPGLFPVWPKVSK